MASFDKFPLIRGMTFKLTEKAFVNKCADGGNLNVKFWKKSGMYEMSSLYICLYNVVDVSVLILMLLVFTMCIL